MIGKQQRNLVDELAALNPVLFAAFKRTEEVAINHWYPGMAQSNGSVNSYPHVQGIINQLSLVIDHPQCAITLTDVELYLLLTSILLHDIGKVKQKENHGAGSRDLIRKHWAELKIENEQIQYIIQNICYLHDRNKNDFQGAYLRLPVDEYIDRYGKVRPRLLGALLYLGDHMDNSYTRTISEEFTNHFRKNVLGVHFQPEQQLITTVIHPEAFLHLPEDDEKKILYSLDYVQETMGPLGFYFKEKSEEIKEHADDQHSVDLEALLYLMRDTYDNDQCLPNIRNELYVLGMPIKKWMLECEGQLFLVQKRKDESAIKFLSKEMMEQVIGILREKPNSRKDNEKKRRLQPELMRILNSIDFQPNDGGNNLVKAYEAYQKIDKQAVIPLSAVDTVETLPHANEALAALQIFDICPQYALKKGGDPTRDIATVLLGKDAHYVDGITAGEHFTKAFMQREIDDLSDSIAHWDTYGKIKYDLRYYSKEEAEQALAEWKSQQSSLPDRIPAITPDFTAWQPVSAYNEQGEIKTSDTCQFYTVMPDDATVSSLNLQNNAELMGNASFDYIRDITKYYGVSQSNLENIGNSLTVTQQEAEAQAKAIVDALGYTDFVCVYGQPVLSDNKDFAFYRFFFLRTIDGVSVNYWNSTSYANENMELIQVSVDDGGILRVSYNNAQDVLGIMTAKTELLPFLQIQSVFEKMILVVNNNTESEIWNKEGTPRLTVEYNISDVRLGLMYVPETSDSSSRLLIPAWTFYGSTRSKVDEKPVEEYGTNGQNALLFINAIDGTVIEQS